jgi:hypothetical protein
MRTRRNTTTYRRTLASSRQSNTQLTGRMRRFVRQDDNRQPLTAAAVAKAAADARAAAAAAAPSPPAAARRATGAAVVMDSDDEGGADDVPMAGAGAGSSSSAAAAPPPSSAPAPSTVPVRSDVTRFTLRDYVPSFPPGTRFRREARAGGGGETNDNVNLRERQAFQDGRKLVGIISEAASAGISLHADRGARNQRRRVHITIQLSWSSMSCIQAFGRTCRANQTSAPHYVLATSDVAGENRFSATVASRLEQVSRGFGQRQACGDDCSWVHASVSRSTSAHHAVPPHYTLPRAQLGALTRGDRRAKGSNDLSAFSFESAAGAEALKAVFRALADRERDVNPKVADVSFLRRAGRQLDAVEDDAAAAADAGAAAAAAGADTAPASQSQAAADGGAHDDDAAAAAAAAPGTPAPAAPAAAAAAAAGASAGTRTSASSTSTRGGVTPADSDRENGEGDDAGGKTAATPGALVPLPRVTTQKPAAVPSFLGAGAGAATDGAGDAASSSAAASSSSSAVVAAPPAPPAAPVSWMGEDAIRRYPDLLEFVAHARGWMVDAGLAEIMKPAGWGGRASKSENTSMWDVVADYRRRTARTVPRPAEQRWWWGVLPAGMRAKLERVVDGGERQRATAAAAAAAAYRGYGRYAGAYGRGGMDEDDDGGGGGAGAGTSSSSSSSAATAPEVTFTPDALCALTAALEDFACGPLASASTLDNRRPGPPPTGPDGEPLPLELPYPRVTLQPAGKSEAVRTNLRKDIRKL